MDMATALAELGVTAATVDAEATERLDRDGYVALPDVLSGEQVEAVRARLAELLAAEGSEPGWRCIGRGALTGSLILSIRAPCSSPVSPIRGC